MNQRPDSDWTFTLARAAAAISLAGACSVLCIWTLAGGYGPWVPDKRGAAHTTTPAQPAQSDKDEHRGPSVQASVMINLNTATQAELESLPGVGPALAERIIADRVLHGPFASVDDLDRVPGIGQRTLDRLRSRVKVELPLVPAERE